MAKGLTQKEFAEKLGISYHTYRSIEQAQFDGRVKTWDKIEDLLGINQRELREKEEPPRCQTCGQTIKKR